MEKVASSPGAAPPIGPWAYAGSNFRKIRRSDSKIRLVSRLDRGSILPEEMSWVTAIWSILIGACIVLALPHLLMGLWSRRPAHLFFVLSAVAVMGIAALEILLMRADNVHEFGELLRWVQVPVFLLCVGLVGFVYSYLEAGRLWLGVTACGLRFVCLVAGFLVQPNVNFRAITGLRHISFLGEKVAVPVGVLSPWTHLGELSSVLLLIFAVDASISRWRRSNKGKRQQAAIVGGSIALFILVAASFSAMTHRQLLDLPYMISFPFAAIVMAMAFELGTDLFRAGEVSHRLELSESSLQESEARFRKMADTALVLIWMSGLDKLCTFFNHAWLHFTGRTLSQELGTGWCDGVHRDDLAKCLETYNRAFDRREPFVMQYRLRNARGEYRWINDSGVPRYGSKGNFQGYIGTCVDISDLLEKERALRKIEERVTLAAEVARLGIWELEVSGKKLWISDNGRKLFAFGPEFPLSYDSFRDRVHPEDRARLESVVERAIQTKGSYEAEYRIQLPDGTVRWIAGRGQCVPDDEGNLTRLIGVSMDITERKQAQHLFQLATEASPSGVVLADTDGRMVLVNAHVEELFGYRNHELIGQPLEILVPARFSAQHLVQRDQLLTQPRARPIGADQDVFARRKDGSEFPVEITLSPIDSPQGVLVLASIVDISARKLAEEEAQRRRDEIELLSRLSLLGEMTASIAHEVNQPLSGIISNASAGQRFIDRGETDPDRLRAILVDIVADGRRAHEVIQNIRNTVKKGGAIREPMDVNQLVRQVTRLMESDADSHSCALQTSLVSELPKVECDPVQIQQVLVNLIGNAFDAMSEIPLAQRKVEVATSPNGKGTICVSVRDHGPGVREENRTQLFEQFFTTKEDGLGMGLAIVRSILEAHRGTIAVENVADGGARFYFTLPISKDSES